MSNVSSMKFMYVMQEIQGSLDRNRKCVRLLENRISKEDELQLFLQALEESKQGHIVEELHNPGELSTQGLQKSVKQLLRWY